MVLCCCCFCFPRCASSDEPEIAMDVGGENGITHRTVEVNGIRMHVAEKGEGPVVLLLHGFPELWYTWRHQIHGLAARSFRAVAPDLRGYGDSDAPPEAADYSAFHVVGCNTPTINKGSKENKAFKKESIESKVDKIQEYLSSSSQDSTASRSRSKLALS